MISRESVGCTSLRLRNQFAEVSSGMAAGLFGARSTVVTVLSRVLVGDAFLEVLETRGRPMKCGNKGGVFPAGLTGQ